MFFLIIDKDITFRNSNGRLLTADEIFEFFGQLMKLVISIMQISNNIEKIIDTVTPFPYEQLIELCPKFDLQAKGDFEDLLDFFRFILFATNSIKGDPRPRLHMCTVKTFSYYVCKKCSFMHENQAEELLFVNVLTMLQKK